jgi:glycosyltransferase involved in cell wall biosynthesis
MVSKYDIVITEIEAFGGAERSVLALSRWLHENNLRHRLIVYYDQIGLQNYASHPLEIVKLNPRRNPLSKILGLRSYFRSIAPHHSKPLVSGVQSALHASAAGLRGFHTLMHDTPSLFSDGGKPPTLAGRIRRVISDQIIGLGLRSGGCTIVTSAYLKAESEQLYGGRVEIVRMGGFFDKGRFRPRVVDDEIRILSVSRIEANKRIDWMLRSLAELEKTSFFSQRHIRWRLDLVGRGGLTESLKNLSRQLGIGDRIYFHGFVSDKELNQIYDRANLFIMPARQGYGIPAVEALYRGIPVLLHRDSGVSDILMDTPWCVIARGGEESFPAALGESINRLLANRHQNARFPAIPSEGEWAESVARLCGWLSSSSAA